MFVSSFFNINFGVNVIPEVASVDGSSNAIVRYARYLLRFDIEGIGGNGCLGLKV